jgi:hypothetical protein
MLEFAIRSPGFQSGNQLIETIWHMLLRFQFALQHTANCLHCCKPEHALLLLVNICVGRATHWLRRHR